MPLVTANVIPAGNNGPVIEMAEAEFEELVSAALDEIPPGLTAQMDNVVVLISDRPPTGAPPDLLGLYEGTPLTERSVMFAGLPDRITIFREPILAMCQTPQQVVEEVRITVIHEVAHHFGIDDDRLHELGWA